MKSKKALVFCVAMIGAFVMALIFNSGNRRPIAVDEAPESQEIATPGTVQSPAQARAARISEYLEEVARDPKYDWKQRIDFYGKVVDSLGHPLNGVSIEIVSTDLSESGNGQWHLEVDPGFRTTG
jgi:protocatechuate 3,4-dioxygenase beta subunit